MGYKFKWKKNILKSVNGKKMYYTSPSGREVLLEPFANVGWQRKAVKTEVVKHLKRKRGFYLK